MEIFKCKMSCYYIGGRVISRVLNGTEIVYFILLWNNNYSSGMLSLLSIIIASIASAKETHQKDEIENLQKQIEDLKKFVSLPCYKEFDDTEQSVTDTGKDKL